ncbi:hypothetical protein IU451_28690 [Nocardia cyriacigeorgica]|uniref:hypothetical protein n=1 Tax=Nocardia cyriacigeorgica TaxID=135487 RepID=UPI00189573F7|nr:hypothetical protein [Nocardia cyriacigeorgica]MBF6326480.1 hypothetical protein [Nocardia cyriacigeorgica]
MNKNRVEIRVNEIVNHVIAGGKVEDDYVEAKAEWPDINKAGQLAGLANAANGHPVLLIVGLDEDAHQVVPLDSTDAADWWPKMQKQFAFEVTPDLTVLRVPTDHGTVMCLHFETDRAPYMVKINSGWATAAIPWRSGTRTRTATRAEVLSLMRDAAAVPQLELTAASFTLRRPALARVPADPSPVTFAARLFVDSVPGAHVVLQRHRWDVKIVSSSGIHIPDDKIRIGPPERRRTIPIGASNVPPAPEPKINPYGITSRPVGLLVLGPDMVEISMQVHIEPDDAQALAASDWIEVGIRLPVGASEQAATVRQHLYPIAREADWEERTIVAKWNLARPTPIDD